MNIEKLTKYRTTDGHLFDDEKVAEDHQFKLDIINKLLKNGYVDPSNVFSVIDELLVHYEVIKRK